MNIENVLRRVKARSEGISAVELLSRSVKESCSKSIFKGKKLALVRMIFL
jgi:hypothetical protein